MIREIRLLKLLVVLMVSICVSLMGCSRVDNKENNRVEEAEYETPLMMARRQGGEIIEYVVNKDKEGLKSMFSKYVTQNHDLDKEIDEFFEFIDGEIVSYDEPDGDETYGVHSKDESKRIRKLEGWIKTIKTSKGRNYSIYFNNYYLYNPNKDKVGMDAIGVIDEDSWEGEIPYRTVKKYWIGN